MSFGREYTKIADIVHTIIPYQEGFKKTKSNHNYFPQDSDPLFSTVNSCFLQDIEALSVKKQ